MGQPGVGLPWKGLPWVRLPWGLRKWAFAGVVPGGHLQAEAQHGVLQGGWHLGCLQLPLRNWQAGL